MKIFPRKNYPFQSIEKEGKQKKIASLNLDAEYRDITIFSRKVFLATISHPTNEIRKEPYSH
jgi:hypothetical protein